VLQRILFGRLRSLAQLSLQAPMDNPANSVFDLSDSEKLQLVQDLWDDLSTTPESVPVYDWQKEELERRKDNLLQNPGSAVGWLELKRRIRRQHGG
jgi:putative addiction module component (TIGR02574 family)